MTHKHIDASKLKLDGKFTKLLKAYAKLLGLKHSIKHGTSCFELAVEVEVYAKTRWYESSLAVYDTCSGVIISDMREYLPDANEDSIEQLSKKILEGTFGKDKSIKSFKGGDSFTIINNKLEFAQKFVIDTLPRNIEELLVKLDLAQIGWKKMRVYAKQLE